MRLLKQPLIVSYILTGIIAGPYVLNVIHSPEHLELFSKFGIIFLLFIVGLHLNPKVIGEVGKVSLVTGLGQICFTSVVGFGLALLLGIDRVAALYVAIALTFSSTIIILKLLSDKGDLEKLYARIAVGFLLVQDIAATLILIGVGVVANSSGGHLGVILAATAAKGAVALVVLLFLTKYVLPGLVKYMAHSQELLFLFSAAWSLGLAVMLAALGFSVEIGALVAGVALASTPYADEMAARLRPLRDLFVLLFFILLGSQLVLTNIGSMILPALLLSAFVLIGNPIIVIALMNWLGYSRKTGFMAGLTVAQISEFSLILAAIGLQVGHLPREIMSLVTLVGLVTIAGSTYLILYAEAIYPKVEKLLKLLELIKSRSSIEGKNEKKVQLVLFGYDRVGLDFVKVFKKLNRPFLVIDFNPKSIERLVADGVQFKFGDAGDPELLEEIDFEEIKLCVSTIPDVATNLLIQRRVNNLSASTITILLGHTLAEAQVLYKEGATFVLMPHFLGSKYASRIISKFAFKRSSYQKLADAHQMELESRVAALRL